MKPQFASGLVLFFQGYTQNEFVIVSLEQYRVRVRVRTSSAAGECEQPHVVAPNSWLHIAIVKPAAKPLGLAVNGADHCVVTLQAETNDTDEPDIYCKGGIYLGEAPLAIKKMIDNDKGHSEPIRSPLGLLGRLTIENHTVDLTQLPHWTPPDLVTIHPSSSYKFSSFTASTTAYYEETLVVQEGNFSLSCVYNLSDETFKLLHSQVNNKDVPGYSASWIKLDLPVEAAFYLGSGNLTFKITANEKSTTLTVSSYANTSSVEGFYSCWLNSPLFSQPGQNIITYSVVFITDDQGKKHWLRILTIIFFYILALMVILLIWLVVEAVLNTKRRSGFYYCRKLNDEEAQMIVHSMIFSDKGMKQLGGTEACNDAYSNYLLHLEEEALKQTTEDFSEQQNNETNVFESNQLDDDFSLEETSPKGPNKSLGAGENKKHNKDFIVGLSSVQHSPLITAKRFPLVKTDSISGGQQKGKGVNLNNSNLNVMPMSEESKDSLYNERKSTNTVNIESDSLINISEKWSKKEIKSKEATTHLPTSNIGHIQKTLAYKNIKNELILPPSKFKDKKHFYSSI